MARPVQRLQRWRPTGTERWRGFAAACCLALSLLFSPPAAAHPAPFSYLDLQLSDGRAQGSLVLHHYDAAHELGIANASTLLQRELTAKEYRRLEQELTTRLIFSADGAVASVRSVAWQPLPSQQAVQWRFELQPAARASLRLQTQLFPYDSAHQTFVNVYEHGVLRAQAILDARQQTFHYYRGTVQGRWSVVQRYAALGAEHLLIGADHWLFLLGLLLMGGSVVRLCWIVSAFTLAHSVTLALAVLGVMRVPGWFIEPAIALSIVVVGADSLLARSTAGQRDLRVWFALAFGLLHGFGFASVLLETGLPREALAWSLAAFNVGVELAQLLLVAPAAMFLWRLRQYSVRASGVLVLSGSVLVVLLGIYWFLQRVIF